MVVMVIKSDFSDCYDSFALDEPAELFRDSGVAFCFVGMYSLAREMMPLASG